MSDPTNDRGIDPYLSHTSYVDRTPETRTDALVPSQKPSRKEQPPDVLAQWQRLLNHKRAPNGLLWQPVRCTKHEGEDGIGGCGRFLHSEGVLIGCLRIRCPNCGKPNIVEINRIGEPQDLIEYAMERGLVNKTIGGKGE